MKPKHGKRGPTERAGRSRGWEAGEPRGKETQRSIKAKRRRVREQREEMNRKLITGKKYFLVGVRCLQHYTPKRKKNDESLGREYSIGEGNQVTNR